MTTAINGAQEQMMESKDAPETNDLVEDILEPFKKIVENNV